MYSFDEILKVDPEIAGVIQEEQKRQDSHIELTNVTLSRGIGLCDKN